MPIIINDIRAELDTDEKCIIEKALKSAGLSSDTKAKLYKTSLDARKRNDIHLVCSVYAELESTETEKTLSERLSHVSYAVKCLIEPVFGKEQQNGRICIAGFGPAGMFCALLLAEYGYKPVVFERGADVDTRIKSVNSYWSGNELDTASNVQFGEGGAGTFSAGKSISYPPE